MPLFSENFRLGLTQPELDFVDVDLAADLAVYVDPFAISLYDDDLSRRANEAVVAFFQAAISSIRSGDEDQAVRMLNNLSEPNETRLGVSRGRPQGRGVSGQQAFDLYRSIASSQAAQSGLISDLSECDLFIEGIGPDKISDITTNVVRDLLIEYTQAQCTLLNIPMRNCPSGRIFDHGRMMWRERYTMLPQFGGQKIILVPKNFVRRSLALNSQEYLNKHVLEYLQAEHLDARSSLVEVLKNGKRRVTKVSLKEHYPCTKEWMATFTAEHPEVLETYKTVRERIAKVERQAEVNWLNGDFDERVFAQALIEKLIAIPPGNADASNYHVLMIGIMEFLFWPNLINPEKEREINEGRKRIDIMYTNAAEEGFFNRVMIAPQTAAVKIPVECKNYSKDPANPEVDQLAGRFAPNRGQLGFLLYRTTDNYDLLIARCRDTAMEGRGFIIPLGDREIIEMLEEVAADRKPNIGRKIGLIFNRIIH